MKRHLTISTIVTLLAVVAAATLSQPSVDARQDNRAQALLDQARAALGGNAKLKAVQSLSATAKFRKMPGKDMPEVSGELQVDFLFPDKYMSTEVSNMPIGDVQITRIIGFNGDQAFRDTRTSGSGMIVVRDAGADDPQAQTGRLRAARAEFARYAIAWLLAPPPAQAVEFSYAGEAQADEGRADVIDVKGADGFAMRLFLDKETHRPLMLTYRGAQQNLVMRTQSASAASHGEAEKLAKEAQEKANKELEAKPPEVKMADMHLYLSDYRSVDGLLLPHHISRAVNGEVNEEWEVTKFKINPPLKAEKFKK